MKLETKLKTTGEHRRVVGVRGASDGSGEKGYAEMKGRWGGREKGEEDEEEEEEKRWDGR